MSIYKRAPINLEIVLFVILLSWDCVLSKRERRAGGLWVGGLDEKISRHIEFNSSCFKISGASWGYMVERVAGFNFKQFGAWLDNP